MRRSLVTVLLIAGVLLAASPLLAQQTTGTIAGRALDQQKMAVPGATVTAKSPQTGFMRTAVTDTEGLYRLSALPVGKYDVSLELAGFATVEKKGIDVNVSQTLTVDFELSVAKMAENVTVTGESPLIETTSSSVGGVVDVNQHRERCRSTAGSSPTWR